jgi:hypothetical protein
VAFRAKPVLRCLTLARFPERVCADSFHWL